ncbi:threonine-phosphate decarboxylase [Swingsia samuiensis]|nr:threonine-phosphate decarboxylase [Swingsia samuiensis]
MKHFPSAPKPFVDLSTGISPYPYPISEKDLVMITALPQIGEEIELYKAAANAYKIKDLDRIVGASGTQLLISLLPYVLVQRHVLILGPTYSGHEISWKNAGASVQIVEDSTKLQKAIKNQSIVVMCNPNNPDGRILSLQEIEAIAADVTQKGGWLILDEAYADFEDFSGGEILEKFNIIMLRSFGKSYGLPGVRLGFLVSTVSVANRMRLILGDWSVNSVAISVGTRALKDVSWQEEIKKKLKEDILRLSALLQEAQLSIKGKSRLFCLVSHPQAQRFWEFLCKRGIVVRSFEERPQELRFGIPRNEEEWTRLEEACWQWQNMQ